MFVMRAEVQMKKKKQLATSLCNFLVWNGLWVIDAGHRQLHESAWARGDET